MQRRTAYIGWMDLEPPYQWKAVCPNCAYPKEVCRSDDEKPDLEICEFCHAGVMRWEPLQRPTHDNEGYRI